MKIKLKKSLGYLSHLGKPQIPVWKSMKFGIIIYDGSGVVLKYKCFSRSNVDNEKH